MTVDLQISLVQLHRQVDGELVGSGVGSVVHDTLDWRLALVGDLLPVFTLRNKMNPESGVNLPQLFPNSKLYIKSYLSQLSLACNQLV